MPTKSPRVAPEIVEKLQAEIDAFVEENPDDAKSSAAVLAFYQETAIGLGAAVADAVRNARLVLRFGNRGERPRVEQITD